MRGCLVAAADALADGKKGQAGRHLAQRMRYGSPGSDALCAALKIGTPRALLDLGRRLRGTGAGGRP